MATRAATQRETGDTEQVSPVRAFDLQAAVLKDCQSMREKWVDLAGNLHAFHAAKAWTRLGADSFNEWVAQPEIALKRSQAYFLVEAWQELVVVRGAEPAVLKRADLTKMAVVLPALRRGDVDLEDALADCESLSRSDLRDKYVDGDGRLDAEGEPLHTQCPKCGSRVTVDQLQAAAA